MILQSTNELEEHIGNKYALVIVAAKRSRQIKEGHIPLCRETSPNPLSIALHEIQDLKIQAIAPPKEEIAPAPRDVIASLVAGTEFDLDEDIDPEDSDAEDDLAALLVGADEEEEEEHTADADDPLVASTDEDEVEEDEEEEEEEEIPLDTEDEEEEE